MGTSTLEISPLDICCLSEMMYIEWWINWVNMDPISQIEKEFIKVWETKYKEA